MDARPDLAQHAARRIAALRALLERLEAEGRSDDAATQAVRELLAEASGTGDRGPDALGDPPDVRPS